MFLRYILHKLKFRFFLRKYLKVMKSRKKFKNKIRKLKLNLVRIEYDFTSYSSNKVFKDLPITLEIFFKQYNLYRLIRSENLNFKLLSQKKLIYPLTKKQTNFLLNQGYNVNQYLSHLYFLFICFLDFLKGVVILISLEFKFFLNIFNSKNTKKKIFIQNLSSENIFFMKNNENNIKNFFQKNYIFEEAELVHDNRESKNESIYSEFFLPGNYTLKHFVNFNFKIFKFFYIFLIDLLSGRFMHIFIFSEIIKYLYATTLDKLEINNSYYFFNTSAFFRPLYSYVFRNNTYFFTYSVNDVGIYYKDDDPEYDQFNLQNLTWENYILWNEMQKKNYQKSQIIKANFNIKGSVLIQNSEKFKKKLNCSKDSLLVFDAVPYRKSFLSYYNNYSPNYFDENIIKFLIDILKINENQKIFLKLKRNLSGKNYSKKYINFIKNNKKIETIDYFYSLEDVINQFNNIICLPFSSSAFIANKLNKKVCYYDVCNINKDFKNIFNEIELIQSIDELKSWKVNL